MALLDTVRRKEKIAVRDLARQSGVDGAEARVIRLVGAGMLVVYESLTGRYRRKRIQLVGVAVPRGDRAALDRAFEAVRRSPGQEKALLTAITLSGYSGAAPMRPIERRDFLDAAPGVTWEHVMALRRKGLLTVETREVSRFRLPDTVTTAPSSSMKARSVMRLSIFIC